MNQVVIILLVSLLLISGCGSAVKPSLSVAEEEASNHAGSLPAAYSSTSIATALAEPSPPPPPSVTPYPTLTLPPATTTTQPVTVTEADEMTASPSRTALATTTASPMLPIPSGEKDQEAASAALQELAHALPPTRDDVRLAQAFKGYSASPQPTAVLPQIDPLPAGTQQSFKVLDVVNNTFSEIEADLMAVGNHAYFWFEQGPFAIDPSESDLTAVAASFDAIYDEVTHYFGQENSPGIDGDPRLHVLHVSPQTMCGVSPEGEGGCATAGFVSSSDFLPASLNPQSNEKEMFVMNNLQFGSDFYLGILAHEFRHLIEDNYDQADTDWEKEGSAVLATELVGLAGSEVQRANGFLSNPDQQLNSWAETGTGPYYGQGYLLNRYLFDRFGESLYRDFATSPLPGLSAFEELANRIGLNLTGDDVWRDWLVALILHDRPDVPGKYRINAEGLDTAALLSIDQIPWQIAADVHQYAADYYQLPEQPVTVSFAGTAEVSLLSGQEPIDDLIWITQRANQSNPRLTRSVDLRKASRATLTYDVYGDIERGYDFAYLSASLDGGQTWQPLIAGNMQGLDELDDPSQSALAPRYYTGRVQEWRHETVDLSPFIGQEVLLRFELVTDPILTYSGLAVDNVAIREIGLIDEGTPDGWTAEGFTLAPASLPQRWDLLLVEDTVDGPLVSAIPVDAQGFAEFTVAAQPGLKRPILIVAGSTPQTLESAAYVLQVTDWPAGP